MSEPIWLDVDEVIDMHAEQLAIFGGPEGIRHRGLLELAVLRSVNQWSDGQTDMAALAAAYAFGLVKNHPYRDGNKRIGFLAMVTFLGMNGHQLETTDAEVVAEMLALADGTVSEEAFADWIRQHSSRRRWA